MNKMNLKQNKIFSGLMKALDTNAPTIATFGSIVGLGLTVFFMHKAAKQAAVVEENYEKTVDDIMLNSADEQSEKEELAHQRMSKYMRLIYIYRWALLSGIGSAGFAVLSNYLNGRTIAGLTTLVALNQDKLQKGAEKVKELVGEEKFEKFQKDLEKDILGDKLKSGEIKTEKSKLKISEDDRPEDGYERYYDCFWSEIYDIPAGRLKDAIAEASRLEYLSWNDWRGMLGLDSAPAGYFFKWDRHNPFKAHIGYVNVGVYGMKAICYDTKPEFDTMGK